MKPVIPEAVLQQNIIALGKTGSGKSSALRLLVESMLESKQPVCIIDPKGDWWGLRLSADGKKPGFPLVIFGGKHADVPINDRSGSAVAELFATGNRPCIIDLGGWMPGERTRFFIDFASTLFRKNIGRRWLLIDEVHNFAPKGKVMDVESGKSLHWANRIASEGRGLGITLIGASQRPQKVHNDLLTSCETLIAMRVLHASDRGAYKDWIDGCGDPAKGKEMLAAIANLKRGTGYVWSPEIEFGPELVKFPMFKTFDSFSPQTTDHAVSSASWETVDLEEVKTKLATVVKEAEENDPKRLRGEIHKLRNEIVNLKAVGAGGKVDKETIEAAQQRGFEKGYMEGEEFGYAKGYGTAISSLVSPINALEQKFEECIAFAKQQDEKAFSYSGKAAEKTSATSELRHPTPAASTSSGTVGNTGLRRMLIALAQRPQGMNKRQLGVRAGMSSSSGTFSTYLGKGRSEGWMNGDATTVRITDAGINALGSYEPLPTGQALLAYWIGELGNSGAARLLQALADAYPKALPKNTAAERAGLSPGSGTFSTYLGKLRTLELISGSGELRASEELFE